MRFFAHDGKDVHGPAVLDELIKLPGFDGDTLVCPVGSENSADWKPALAYPSFREALLAPAPRPAPLPPPAPAPAPAPIPFAPAPAPTTPCPRCGRANPEDARFCNGCAARMDGREEAPPLVPVAAPTPAPAPAPEPERMFARAPEPAPEPVFAPSDPLVLAPEPAAYSPEPAPEPAAAPASSTWRKTLIASFVGATAASAGLGWWLLRPAKHAEPPVAELTMPAPVVPAPPVVPTPAPVPMAMPPAAAAPAPVAASPAPARAPKAAPKVDLNDLTKATPPPSVAKRARRKARKPKPAPAPAAAATAAAVETLIESHDKTVEPAMPGDAPAAEPAAPSAAEDRGFLLPGVPRRTTSQSVTKPKAAAAAPPSSAPAAAAAPDAARADGAAPAADAPDDGTTKQVREQFVFCAQLLSQGAYADHFDTCLCADARQAAPYRGRRGYYAASMKKAEAAGTLATSAAVKGIVLDGPIAKVTADWKSSSADKPRTETENWQLEDGLWCRYP